MKHIPILLAGVAAGVILLGVTAHKKKNLHANGKIEEFKIDNIKAVDTTKATGADDPATLKPEKDELKNITAVKLSRLPEYLEVKYPGLKNFEIQNADKVAVKV